ncbi:MAG TPA: SRPBCC family protein [Polyangiaceae bacterium]|jgi:hypothetical protein
MASIYKQVRLDVSAERAWDALRDFYQVHTRLVPGFVTECRAEAGARVVTFFNGLVARELFVACDDGVKRVAYSSVGGRATHHNASAQIFDEGAERCRLVWITDVLPDELAGPIGAMMDRGAEVMKATLGAARG